MVSICCCLKSLHTFSCDIKCFMLNIRAIGGFKVVKQTKIIIFSLDGFTYCRILCKSKPLGFYLFQCDITYLTAGNLSPAFLFGGQHHQIHAHTHVRLVVCVFKLHGQFPSSKTLECCLTSHITYF